VISILQVVHVVGLPLWGWIQWRQPKAWSWTCMVCEWRWIWRHVWQWSPAGAW